MIFFALGRMIYMRNLIAFVVMALTLALGTCAIIARRSKKSIAPSVALLLGALIPPVIGNLVIISSSTKDLSTIGCYIYFLGMDLVMLALSEFTLKYCDLSWPNKALQRFVYSLLCIDGIQLLLNPIFHHAFSTEPIMVDGSAYYRLIPYFGQTFHRVVDYGIFFAVLIVFFLKMRSVPRVYYERYSVIFFTMVFTGLWESYYIFSRTPIDQSMIGFGVFGLLVFYFSLYYRPVRLLERMLANNASEMPEGLFLFDAVGRCVWANRPGIELTKAKDYEQCTQALHRIFGDVNIKGVDWDNRSVVTDNNQIKYYALKEHAMTDSKNRLMGTFLTVRDETEQQLALKQEIYNATHDSLTGLYTRKHLFDCTRKMLDSNRDTHHFICYMDVSDFKIINDVFGKAFGDYALQCIADSMRKHLPKACVYGRLSGDTFGMCIPASVFNADAARMLVSGLTVQRDNHTHTLLMHQGVYEVTEPELDVSVMFDRAHMALMTIKGDYKRHVAFYDARMREQMLWDQQLSSQLEGALREGQIRPYLQAIMNSDGTIVGAEALVRWIHPVHGFLSPAMFVPLFEKNGMIADMDRHMWRCACEILQRWRNDLFISINISPKDFYFMDVVRELQSIVEEYGVKPSRLRVEITETVMMQDNENRIDILNQLKQRGFLVEMDDFGSGFSSLNMLKDMPVDVIKIDMLFLRKTQEDDRGQKILRNVMNLTNDLGLSSLTEGVETEEQYNMLLSMGCKLFQGYYFSKPIPVDQFETTFSVQV